MALAAILTVGWPEGRSGYPAAQLDRESEDGPRSYLEEVSERARALEVPLLTGLEQLFRRRPGGYSRLKRLLGALGQSFVGVTESRILCEIDVFAYAFLKGAKNIDFLLPEQVGEREGTYRRCQSEWKQVWKALEDFERRGIRLPEDIGFAASNYLDLRQVLVRGSTRDEKRALANLLFCGPSTMEEISQDLGLNYTLGQRVLSVFIKLGVVEHRPGSPQRFAIPASSLALVVFCLRETMGIDLLTTLG